LLGNIEYKGAEGHNQRQYQSSITATMLFYVTA